MVCRQIERLVEFRNSIRSRVVLVSLLVLTTIAARANAQTDSSRAIPFRSVRAVRVEGRIELDGRLDESTWLIAPPATGFRQAQPNEGRPATLRTEVHFAFDRNAIYVGARMYDDLGAAGVRSRLVRRDRSAEADELSIVFDTFHDHLGQTRFSVNPSGVRGDAFGPGGAEPDPSWDPVWQVETRIDSLGWTAEARIPFSQLRFPRDSAQTWGLQIVRQVSRLNEWSRWAFWRLNEVGGPPRFGHLEGLEIAAAPGKAEILPYLVGRSSNIEPADTADPFSDPHELDYRLGIDFKYLLTSNLTLTGTINPDFGQVEVDPAVVNLSAFETFFPERRPFFIEGSGLLRFGWTGCFFCSDVSPLSLFYSRRIGRAPQGSDDAYDAGDYADVPENTTILGAAKITGRTEGGWSVGVLDAVTRRERATVMGADASRFTFEVEPVTNYFVGRLAKDLRGGDLVLGGMVTSLARDFDDGVLRSQLNRHAEGLGFESDFWWGERTYRLMTDLAFSQIAGDSTAVMRAQYSSARYFQRPDRHHGRNGLFTDSLDPGLTSMRGFAAYARVSKESGDWLGEVATHIRSPGFEVNDLAFLTRADYVWMNANVFRKFTRPTKLYRQLVFIGGGQQQYNFDGDLTDRQMRGLVGIQSLDYWDINAFWIHRFSVIDDRLTRGGPVVRAPGWNFFSFDLSTNSRRDLVFSTEVNRGCNSEGACDYTIGLGVTCRPAPNISISLEPNLHESESTAQYVAAYDDPTATAFFGRRYVFADLEHKTVSMDTRLNVTLTPDLTLEVFAQPLISSGSYTNFKEFDNPRELAKSVYGIDIGTIELEGGSCTIDSDGDGPGVSFTFRDPDFNFRSLRGNALLRWEFRPGSTLYLVWTQSRSNVEPIGNMDLGRDVNALFGAPADDIFLVKVNYWVGF